MIFLRVLIICFHILLTTGLECKIVRIIPWWKTYAKDTEFFCPPLEWPPVALPLKEALNKLGFEVTTVRSFEDLSDLDYILAFHFPFSHDLGFQRKFDEIPVKKKILYLWETPIYMPEAFCKKKHLLFSKIFSWNDAILDQKKYLKLFYPSLRAPMRSDLTPFKERKFCTLVSSQRFSIEKNELHTARNKLVNFFEERHPTSLDLYGRNWPRTFKTYKGPAKNKLDLLNQYKFYICYENSSFRGYITEKIFDCFYSGCIPIYLGAPDIETYIPKNCYIDRRLFENDTKLYQYLSEMSEETYQNYLTNIREFLASDESCLFSVELFLDNILTLLRPSYKKHLIFTPEQLLRLKRAQVALYSKKNLP